MPNPTRTMTSTDFKRLTSKQKATVRKLRRAKMPLRVYSRSITGTGRSRLSVHNPFIDAQRTTKIGNLTKTKRYPHARDTEFQITHKLKIPKTKTAKTRAKKGRKPNKNFMRNLFFP